MVRLKSNQEQDETHKGKEINRVIAKKGLADNHNSHRIKYSIQMKLVTAIDQRRHHHKISIKYKFKSMISKSLENQVKELMVKFISRLTTNKSILSKNFQKISSSSARKFKTYSGSEIFSLMEGNFLFCQTCITLLMMKNMFIL